MSGRIVLHLDTGLGWTKPVIVACCRTCGTELARHPNQATAIRAARRTRCPGCGTRTARRLPGTTSPTTDLALTGGLRDRPGRQPRPPAQRPLPRPTSETTRPRPSRSSPSRPFWKEPCHGSR